MAPSPGTDNPAMNRDVSAMEASAARASGRTRGGTRAGAGVGGAEFDDDALDENRVGVGGREGFITTDAQGSAPSVDTHS